MNGAGKRFVCEGCKKESGNEWEGGNDREGKKRCKRKETESEETEAPRPLMIHSAFFIQDLKGLLHSEAQIDF